MQTKAPATPPTKKLFVKTYGCQMNVYDSERMASALSTDGYTMTDSPDNADVILLNTCHIREKAAEKIYSELGRYKPLKKANPDLKIGVAGCVAQAEGEEIIRRQPMVDLVVGPQVYHRLPAMLRDLKNGRKALIDTEFPPEDKFDHLPPLPQTRRAPSAFLTVQEGCDKFCSFCVVPYTRGAELSRSPDKIIAEARDLVARGVREITLLGQNVNAYCGVGADGVWPLARLIRGLAEVDDLLRIRFVTSHPNDMDADLIAAHGEVGKLMPYLHLPVQSGSDKILKAMNRKHTAADYLAVIDQIKSVRPDMAVSGDFIVGFPGETEADFEATLEVCRAVQYAQAYSFKYSPRPGTPAAGRAGQVEEAVKTARLARLQALLKEQQVAFQQNLVGRDLSVLVEGAGREDGQMVGRCEYLIPVHIMASPDLVGQIVPVRITESQTNSLHAVVNGEL